MACANLVRCRTLLAKVSPLLAKLGHFACYLQGFRIRTAPPRVHSPLTMGASQNTSITAGPPMVSSQKPTGSSQSLCALFAIYQGFAEAFANRAHAHSLFTRVSSLSHQKTPGHSHTLCPSLAICEGFTPNSSETQSVLAAPPHVHPLFTRVSSQNTSTTRRPSPTMFTLTRYLRGFRRKTFLAPDGRRQPCSRSLAIYEGFIAQPSKTQGPSPTLCTFARFLQGFRVEAIGPSRRPHRPSACSHAIYEGFIAKRSDQPKAFASPAHVSSLFTGVSSLSHPKPTGPCDVCELRSPFTRISRRSHRTLTRSSPPLHTLTRYLRGFRSKTLLPPEGRRSVLR